MKSVNKIVLSVSLLFTSLSYAAKFDVEMYKSPQCGCCTEWAEILEAKGYQVEIHEQNQWNDVKQKFGMPAKMTSCHTAIIDGYLIEGHVPEREIARLLKERPEGLKGLPLRVCLCIRLVWLARERPIVISMSSPLPMRVALFTPATNTKKLS